jgi:hypothetical protein
MQTMLRRNIEELRSLHGRAGAELEASAAKDTTVVIEQWMFAPDSRTRLIWDAVQVGGLAYIAVTVPLRAGFDFELTSGSFAWVIELIVDLYFCLDIWLNFRTGYIDKTGELIMDKALIRRRYLRSWFSIDFIAMLPVNYMVGLITEGSGTKTAKILRLIRVSKLLRLARMRRLVRCFLCVQTCRLAKELQPRLHTLHLIARYARPCRSNATATTSQLLQIRPPLQR